MLVWMFALLAVLGPAAPQRTGVTRREPAAMDCSAHAADQYVSKIKSHAKWRSFPLSIYFIRDRSYNAERAEIARSGFTIWAEATNGFINLRVTDNPNKAQVKVRFDPSTINGHTVTCFSRARIISADITIGVDRASPSDIGCTAAHEFGHALGLDGHSDVRSDLMYPVHMMRSSWSLTRRDLNTLAAVYDAADLAEDWTPLEGP